MGRMWPAAAITCLLLGVVPASADTDVPEVEVLVLFEATADPPARSLVHGRAGATVTGRIPELNLDRVTVPVTTRAVYRSSPLVKAVQAGGSWRVMARRPKDPLLHLQWALPRVNAFDAWRIEKGKRNDVTVAVIDTGVDGAHEDLKGRLEPGFDFVNLDDSTADDQGHGTHVSGIIAANVSNRRGVAGLSWGAKVIPMKACAAAGDCPLFAVHAAAVDAVRRGATILNLSLGGAGPCGDVDQAVFDWVRSQGALAVVAAGNAGAEKNPTITPANCDNTLGVGAITVGGKRAKFSSYGDFVDIAAPGVSVWSTYPPLLSIQSGHIGYYPGSGTSMAAPVVAGIAALVKARHPDWGPERIEQRLIKTATDAGKKGRDDHYGAGIVNALRAVR